MRFILCRHPKPQLPGFGATQVHTMGVWMTAAGLYDAFRFALDFLVVQGMEKGAEGAW